MLERQNLIGKTVLTYWQVDEFIGSGGYGNVYKAHRNIGKDITNAAIKHIVIPEPEQYKERLISNRNNIDQTDKYFKKLYDDILNEIRTMDRLTGKSVNIVAYRNHEVIEHYDPKRYEIFIEMEYLKPFSTYCIEKNMTVGEVLKMGMEIASALGVCHSKDIMHRDIKESNIFIDSDGNFKLGDFGLAKILVESSKAKSDAGTAAYKAPEVALPFGEYRKTVDIYSLGIVLYRMFNNGRIPFLPPYPEEYDYDDETNALGRRLRCEPLPRPRCATRDISEVILKACAPKPENRYQTAAEMRMAIKLLINELNKVEIEKPVDILPEEYTRMIESNMLNYSFGKSINHDENYVHESIFDSSDAKKKRDNTSFEDKDRLLWEAAKKEGTEKAVKEYLESDNPVKAYEREAWKWLDEYYWGEAYKKDTTEAYDRYLVLNYPMKMHNEDAKSRIDKLKRVSVGKGNTDSSIKKSPMYKAWYGIAVVALVVVLSVIVFFIVQKKQSNTMIVDNGGAFEQTQQSGQITIGQADQQSSIHTPAIDTKTNEQRTLSSENISSNQQMNHQTPTSGGKPTELGTVSQPKETQSSQEQQQTTEITANQGAEQNPSTTEDFNTKGQISTSDNSQESTEVNGIIMPIEVKLIDVFPKDVNGDNGIWLQYRTSNGEYKNMGNVEPYHFRYIDSDKNKYYLETYVNDRSKGWIKAHPMSSSKFFQADNIIRIKLDGEYGKVHLNGKTINEYNASDYVTSGKYSKSEVRFYIYKGENSYMNPIWQKIDDGYFDIDLEYKSGEELFLAVDSGSSDICDWANWVDVCFSWYKFK